MNIDQAKSEIASMEQERATNVLCPSCAAQEGSTHRPNCQWLAKYTWLQGIVEASAPEGALLGPNFKWGDPCGTYEFEIVPGGALFFYRQSQLNGGMLEIKIPLSTQALAEMQALIGMIEFPFKVTVPDGKVAGHC